ncbi:MAG: hypothetical protein M1469_10545 [Bacteroidetes bacterium]|nr:hypothetical protein [Bacteroidota bacterium]
MKVLVDSSVWIDFFRRRNSANQLPVLLREDLAVVNQLIMAEIVPALEIRKQKSTIADLKILTIYEMNINWDEIVKLQIRFVKEFKYFVAITDLAIFQNARENDLVLYSPDRDLISLCKMTRHTSLK